MARRHISPARKLTYTLGLLLLALGFLLFFAAIALVFMGVAGDPFHILRSLRLDIDNIGQIFLLPVIGAGMVGVGMVLVAVGRGGVAGSGLVLDPQRARQDLEPWARMGGGIIKDALDESGIQLQSNRWNGSANAQMPFDEQLRRLHELHEGGILSTEEYETQKRRILENS